MSFKLKNFTISAFNNDVNNSGDLNDKFNKWADYRTGITKIIEDACSKTSDNKSIIIFGAGECNDIDLKFLSTKFERIVLTDVDSKSIHDGISRQGLIDSERSKIEIKRIEYTGLAENKFFYNLERMASRSASIYEITAFLKKQITDISQINDLLEYENCFDIVLSCPIYTQIVYTQVEVFLKILAQFNLYSEEDIKIMKKMMHSCMERIISRFNDLLISVTRLSGHLLVIADVIELSVKSDALKEVSKIIDDKPVDTQLLEHFTKEYGLPFSKIGFNDLDAKVNRQKSFWSIWPFDEYKKYLVCIIVNSKINRG